MLENCVVRKDCVAQYTQRIHGDGLIFEKSAICGRCNISFNGNQCFFFKFCHMKWLWRERLWRYIFSKTIDFCHWGDPITGTYYIHFALFSHIQPTMQILINTQQILLLNTSAGLVVFLVKVVVMLSFTNRPITVYDLTQFCWQRTPHNTA